jgi:hypothetical protein
MAKLQHHPTPRTPARFRVKRLPMAKETLYPWCVHDESRPAYIGRFKTHRAAVGYIDGVLRGEARNIKKMRASLALGRGPSIRDLSLERLRNKVMGIGA